MHKTWKQSETYASNQMWRFIIQEETLPPYYFSIHIKINNNLFFWTFFNGQRWHLVASKPERKNPW